MTEAPSSVELIERFIAGADDHRVGAELSSWVKA